MVVLASTAGTFSLNTTNLNLYPRSDYYKPFCENDFGFDYKDETTWTFKYQNKIWEYKAEDLDKNASTFELNFELKKYRKNIKNNKMFLIKKMQQLNFDNELIINYLFPNLLNLINKIQKNIEKQPKNAIIKASSNINGINIKKEIIGIKINLNNLFELIIDNYQKNNNIKIDIPCDKILPEITKDMLIKATNKRASFSTNFETSKPDRKHNIRQAIKMINGKVLEPDEVFSFNKVVGNRTEENGYRVAKIIVNGSYTDGVGGGVCQVSSTLYNAVLLSGLKVLESNKHSERVNYVKAGFDAMVNYGSSDLKFVNNTQEKIYIFASAHNDKISISIFGEKMNYQYELKNEILDIIAYGGEEIRVDDKKEFIDKVEYNDEYFYLKYARDGCTIKSYRYIYSNNVLIEKEILRIDKYTPQNAIKIVGSKIREEIPEKEE